MLAAVTPEHWKVRLVTETVSEIPYDEPWDLVGITGMGSGLARAWQIADRFRSRGVTVVIGGIAATLLGPEVSLPTSSSGTASGRWTRVPGAGGPEWLRPHS